MSKQKTKKTEAKAKQLNPTPAKLGALLKKAREPGKVGHTEIGAAMGISSSLYAKLENGDREMTPEYMEAIVKHLHPHLDEVEAYSAAGLVPPRLTRWLIEDPERLRKALRAATPPVVKSEAA